MKKPGKDFSTRYSLAKRFRDAERPYIEEVLMYICPGRERDFTTARQNRAHHVDEAETYTSFPEEMATDFAGDLVTYFTPGEVKWANFVVTQEIPKDLEKAVLGLVQDREDRVFDLIESSNYNDIAPQVTFEANHGTPAMWIEAGHITSPIHVETVPPHELLITPGHRGILDRFREKSVDATTLKALFEGYDVDLSEPKIQAKMKKAGAMCAVCWGFWLDWDDPGNPLWRCEITVDGHRITPDEPLTLGPLAGNCPLLVGRFNPQVGRPWGRGPGRKSLPDMRVLDKIDEIILSGMDQSILNTLIYPDDGFLDLSDGVEAGKAYAARAGFDRNSIFELNKDTNLDQGWFSEEALEERIRRGFYQDGPRQRGDTPPTASQWLDERRRIQQRLGKPSAPLWTEFFYPFIQRVEKLGVDLGRLEEAITHQGETISVSPISPLQKAQNQDKVLVSRSNLELGFAVFQDQVGNFVDPVGTFQNIVKASGDELTVIREEETPVEGTTPPPE